MMKQFLIALQFLTILPIKIKSQISREYFGQSLAYFPLVGILIGILLAIISIIFNYLPHLVLGAIVLVISIIITGGIHLDGFADTCDGFYGARSKEEILAIMRDSRIGVMGTIGVACILLLKFSLIVSIPQNHLWKALILMATFARWAQVLACYSSDYARENGKARFFIEYASLKGVIIGGLLTFTLFLLLVNVKGVLLFLLAYAVVFLFIKYIKKKIDGMTGDTIGATSEIAEIAVLFFALIYLR